MLPIVLGWINFGLFLFITSPFWINLLGRRVFHAKGPHYVKFLKFIRRAHKPLGVVLLGTAFVHGTIALGGISLHTGLLVALAIAVIVALGVVFFRTRKKAVFKAHRAAALVCLGLLLVHIIFPNLLYMFG
jgi:drug/metabolite transporter (DMT)-like permease